MAIIKDACKVRYRVSVAVSSPRADTEGEADLLRDMIQAGFRVVQFRSQLESLEDVFLQVTKGHVQ